MAKPSDKISTLNVSINGADARLADQHDETVVAQFAHVHHARRRSRVVRQDGHMPINVLHGHWPRSLASRLHNSASDNGAVRRTGPRGNTDDLDQTARRRGMAEQDFGEGGFRLKELLDINAKRMSLELKSRLLSHPGQLGSDREEIIRDFLRRNLPSRFEVSTGFVFDAAGKISKQIDIVIVDSQVCPLFETPGKVRIFPCEAVLAVGEIKSSMTSTAVMREALENLESVKCLDRSTGGYARDATTGQPIDHTFDHLHQIFTFVFVCGDILSKETAVGTLMDFIAPREPHLWPNIVVAPDTYLLTYCCALGVCPNPMDARGVTCKQADDKDDLLLRFYMLLAQALSVTAAAHPPYNRYLSHLKTWNSDLLRPDSEDGSEHMSSWLRRGP
jgi:hypothetical protein